MNVIKTNRDTLKNRFLGLCLKNKSNDSTGHNFVQDFKAFNDRDTAFLQPGEYIFNERYLNNKLQCMV
jgi:hypothetical protein